MRAVSLLVSLVVALGVGSADVARAQSCFCNGGASTICTAQGFARIANNLSESYQLCADINLAELGLRSGPIVAGEFRGSLIGNGRTIYGAHIDSFGQYVGVFERATSASFSNVVLDQSAITGRATYTGGLVGYASNSTFTNVTVRRSTITNPDPNAISSYTGGILGYGTGFGNETVLRDVRSESTTIVTSNRSRAGGVVGGIFGGTLERASSSASVTGRNSSGGLAGICHATILQSSWGDARVSVTQSNAGGLVGYSDGCHLRDVRVAGVVSGPSSVGGMVGHGLNTWIRGSASAHVSGGGGLGGIGGVGGIYAGGNASFEGVADSTVLSIGARWPIGPASSQAKGLYNTDRNPGLVGGGQGRTAAQLRQLATYTALGLSISSSTTDTTQFFLSPVGVLFAEPRWSRCGNAVSLPPFELCDDGNLTDGDGCSSVCSAEQRPLRDVLAGAQSNSVGVPSSQTFGLQVRFDRDGIVSGLGATSVGTHNGWPVYCYLSLHDASGSTVVSGMVSHSGVYNVWEYASVAARNVRAGEVYTVVLNVWGGSSPVLLSSTPPVPLPFGSGDIEAIQAVIGTSPGSMPTQPTQTVPLIDVVFAPDPRAP